MPSQELTIALAMLFLILVLIQKAIIGRQENKALLPLSPSPPCTSIIAGHIPTVLKAAKKHRQCLLFQKWAEEYGEVFFVQLGTIQEYFINSDQSAGAIFDKGAAQTSERPRWIATAFGLTNLNLADAGLPFLYFEALKFLNEIPRNTSKGADPQSLWSSIGRYTYSTFSSQIFGLDVPDDDSPVIDYIFETGLAQILDVCKKSNRVPVFEGLERVPYIRQVMKDSWRWRPPVALGHPHTTTRDIIYKDYRTSKGARIHLNTWAIHRDPKRYPDPDNFIPERFEGDTRSVRDYDNYKVVDNTLTRYQSQESAASPDVAKRDYFVFGAGRRVCVVVDGAEDALL
ncbi:hypothetical protein FGADI_750 [Fusarium gaditjirri]|uniref:Cytochrome P450 n=1 Tax=Fusarium gaditjirri TaxID=282569 RepID=A0A8H4TMZ0_9HYPO|nr:hypothetical protein FGADI_750 [Fusarium gaditjirri]